LTDKGLPSKEMLNLQSKRKWESDHSGIQ
jgi:hypothetical protein